MTFVRQTQLFEQYLERGANLFLFLQICDPWYLQRIIEVEKKYPKASILFIELKVDLCDIVVARYLMQKIDHTGENESLVKLIGTRKHEERSALLVE